MYSGKIAVPPGGGGIRKIITCLPTIYKIMTSRIKVIIYDHCQKLNILNEEQKGCVKECFGCKEQLIIDTVIMEQVRKNNRNIYTAFIDYKKAYDSVPHSWLIKILKIYKINLDLINFLSHVMTFWRTTLNLSINNTKLKSEPIQIKRGNLSRRFFKSFMVLSSH
jgi:hypothetical protein